MSAWNPALYARFEDERTRPAADLLARVPIDTPQRVVDLGCGPGNSTELQAQFLAEYQQRVDQAYPVRADGKRLLAFSRLFIVAQRRDG